MSSDFVLSDVVARFAQSRGRKLSKSFFFDCE